MREPDGSHVSLTTFRERVFRVFKVGARFARHAHNIVVHMNSRVENRY